jgi:hypothetical protein
VVGGDRLDLWSGCGGLILPGRVGLNLS